MYLSQIWFTTLLFIMSFISIASFIRRLSRTFKRVGRSIRRATRKIGRVQRRMAKTDPKVFNAINESSLKHIKAEFDKEEWITKKKLKRRAKNKVKIDIEKELQESPMRDMRGLVDKTVDATVDLAFLKEIERRGDDIKIYNPIFGKVITWVVLPLVTTGIAGGLTYTNPSLIPPGNIVVPEQQIPPTGGNPPPIDPVILYQSIGINAAVYGIGVLLLIGLVVLLRNRR